MSMERRRFLAAAVSGFALTPLAALLAACGKHGDWPEGMAEIRWDRDVCVRCNMVISDRRFAAELRGGEKHTAFRFDDIGCLVFWLRDKAAQYPWMADPATRLWVADAAGKPGETVRWLDPRTVHFVGGRSSPMGYNFAALATPEAGSIDFGGLQKALHALGK